jgi:hypothetical protein
VALCLHCSSYRQLDYAISAMRSLLDERIEILRRMFDTLGDACGAHAFSVSRTEVSGMEPWRVKLAMLPISSFGR